MKVKTFRFIISSYYVDGIVQGRNGTIKIGYNDLKTEKTNCGVRIVHSDILTESEIDKTINSFIENKDVTDIKINTEVLHRHNNGRNDTVVRTYTILYK